MSNITTKEEYASILRAPKVFKKKKAEIVAFFKSEGGDAQLKSQSATNLSLACADILNSSPSEEKPVSKMSCMLIIKDVMDLGQPPILIAISQNILPIFKTTVIQFKDDDPIGKTYFSEIPTEEQEQIGYNVVIRMVECLFAWACWHYRNSNGTKTRFFLALEGCMRGGVEFPEEEKFIHFTREELFLFQGKSGFQVVLYMEDLVNMSFQIGETINFLKSQFQVGEKELDEQTLEDCKTLYEEFISESKNKDLSQFFPEDKSIYEIEIWFVEKTLPKIKKFSSGSLTFFDFTEQGTQLINQYIDQKKQLSSVGSKSGTSFNNSKTNIPPPNPPPAQPWPKGIVTHSAIPTTSKQQPSEDSSKSNSVQHKPAISEQIDQDLVGNRSNHQIDQQNKREIKEDNSKIDTLNQKIRNLENTIQDYEQIKEKQEKELHQKKREAQSLQSEIEEERISIKEKDIMISELNKQLSISQNQKNLSGQQQQEEFTKQTNKIIELSSELDRANLALSKKESEANSLKQMIDQKANEITQIKRAHAQEVSTLKENINNLQLAVTNKTQDFSEQQRLEEELQLKSEAILLKDQDIYQIQQEIIQLKDIVKRSEQELYISNQEVKRSEFEWNKKEIDWQKEQKRLMQLIEKNSKDQQNNHQTEQKFNELENELEKKTQLVTHLQSLFADEEEKALQQTSDILRLKEDILSSRQEISRLNDQQQHQQRVYEEQILELQKQNQDLEEEIALKNENLIQNKSSIPEGQQVEFHDHDYQDRVSYKERVHNYQQKIGSLEQENNIIPLLQNKISELERIITAQQKENQPVTVDQKKSFNQVMSALANVIKQSELADLQLKQCVEQMAQQRQAPQMPMEQNLIHDQQGGSESGVVTGSNQIRTASISQIRQEQQALLSQANTLQHQSSPKVPVTQGIGKRMSSTQPGGFFQQSQPIRLSELNNMKATKFNEGAYATGFPSQFQQQIQNNQVDNFQQTPFGQELTPLPENYQEDQSSELEKQGNFENVVQLREVDKAGADMLFPFRNPKMYYQNKANLKNEKGELVLYNEKLFSNIRYSSDILYRFKRSCLKWKFSIFESEDLQIGQISSFDVTANQYMLKLGLYFTNKLDYDIQDLSINIIPNHQFQISKDKQIFSASIHPSQQLRQSLTIAFYEIPFEVVVAEIKYRVHNIHQRIQIPIPCLLTKYLEIQDISSLRSFKQMWQEISKFNLIRSQTLPLNLEIARNPNDLHNYFPSFICLNDKKADQYLQGINDYIIGGQIYLRQPNVTFLMKIYLKPNNQISFKIASGSNAEDVRIVEFFLQNLLFLYTQLS